MKCEDVLMSSDLFSNDLFSDFSNDGLHSSNESPFDFINTTYPNGNFAPNDPLEDATKVVSEFLENPQSLFYPNESDGTNDVKSDTNAVPNVTVVAANNNTAVAPKAVSTKGAEVKTPLHQMRNIQPKPDTSTYRIVPVKTVSNVANSQPQSVKICNPSSVAADGVASSTGADDASVKKVLTINDLNLLNQSNVKKQVR